MNLQRKILFFIFFHIIICVNFFGQSKLYYAIQDGNVNYLKRKLKQGLDPDCGSSGMSNSPFMFALHNFKDRPEDYEMLDLLLEYGADINIQNVNGYTFLMSVLRNLDLQLDNKMKVVDYLVTKGADLNLLTNRKETALWDFFGACTYEEFKLYEELFIYLVEAGTDISIGNQGSIMLYHSAYCKSDLSDFMKVLLDHGADPHYKMPDKHYVTPFFQAAYSGKPKDLEVMCKAGAAVNYQINGGYTVLMHVTREGYTKCVKVLLEHKADPNISDDRGESALYKAIDRFDKPEIVKLLLHYGADYTILPPNASPLIVRALRIGYHKNSPLIVSCLLQAGVDPNGKDKDGKTYLYLACGNSTEKTMQVLIDAGADVNGENFYSKLRPITNAINFPDSLKVLLENGAEVNFLYNPLGTSYKTTPLIYAVYNFKVESVKLLLKYGADVTMVSERFGTALDLAKERRYYEIQTVLEEHIKN